MLPGGNHLPLELAYFVYFIGRLGWWPPPHLPQSSASFTAYPAPLGHCLWVCTTEICPSPLLPGLWLTSFASHFQVVTGPDGADHVLGTKRATRWSSEHRALLWLLCVQCLLKTTNQWETTSPWFSWLIKLMSPVNVISNTAEQRLSLVVTNDKEFTFPPKSLKLKDASVAWINNK